MNRVFLAAAFIGTFVAGALADNPLPPFDFSDQFYQANGVNPATLVGRPTGTGANSVIDNRENGPNFNNIRMLEQTAAYDHSGHRIFFYVTGLPRLASFTTAASLATAEAYNVYEFPRAANPQFAVFPKRQDLIADLRNGYFSHDPLGVWRVNTVKYTAAATDTSAGRAALAQLSARNGLDIDGTPIIKTIDEIQSLRSQGFVAIEIPPMDGSGGFRWFFCPVLNDPRNGAIATDAHLAVTESSDAAEFRRQFECLRTTGDWCSTSGSGGGRHSSDCDGDGHRSPGDIFSFLGWYFGDDAAADFDDSGSVGVDDIFAFLHDWFQQPD